MVGRAFDEAELGSGGLQWLECGEEDVFAVFCAVGSPVEKGFEVVEEGVGRLRNEVVRHTSSVQYVIYREVKRKGGPANKIVTYYQ